MKTMTCNQLGGACDTEFHANTFEEMAELSKSHGMEMIKAGDSAHLEAMEKMKELMTNSEEMQEWMQAKMTEFNTLPQDK